jgi:hypothetical protein
MMRVSMPMKSSKDPFDRDFVQSKTESPKIAVFSRFHVS